MTGFSDNIYTGLLATTSALASYSQCKYSRVFNFNGTSGTQNFVLPSDVQCLDAKMYITQQGSAATSDAFTVSAGGTNLITITQLGSATGVLRNTTTSLGVLSTVASACAGLSQTAEVSAAITYVASDAAAAYTLELSFTRLRRDPLGNP